jgi:hypothetical protein
MHCRVVRGRRSGIVWPNSRLESARVARPTRKGEAPLLAAQPERWTVGQE